MKLIFTILALLISFGTFAASVKQKDLNFIVRGEELLKGDVVYSVDLMTRPELEKFLPDFIDLDTTGFTKPKSAKLLVSKAAYVVNKPAGFFDQDKAVNLDYLNYVLGEQKVTTLDDRTFKVVIPGKTPQSYKLRTHFDSDDISSTANSRAIRAITAAKKMDIQVQGAQTIIVREMWDFSKGSHGAIHVTAYLTLTEHKTLVIDYGLLSLVPPLLARETLEESVRDEAAAQQSLINTYKAK
jgi:hypothetical protein